MHGFISALSILFQFGSVQFSHSVVSNSLQPHELQHARPPCPSPTPGVHPNSCPLSWWCPPTISSSVFPFSSCSQSFPGSGFFPVSGLSTSGGQSIRASFSASVLIYIYIWVCIYHFQPPNLCSIYSYYKVVGCIPHGVQEPLRLPYTLLYLPLSQLHVTPPSLPTHLAFGGAVRHGTSFSGGFDENRAVIVWKFVCLFVLVLLVLPCTGPLVRKSRIVFLFMEGGRLGGLCIGVSSGWLIWQVWAIRRKEPSWASRRAAALVLSSPPDLPASLL